MSTIPQAPTRIDLEQAGQLPSPQRERWQPLRVGLVDLFHYDHQEFWFRDGRLLWRGNNGTGKSKVLALTLPFLLDGDLSAHRVEPDGDPKKRMEWNLLLNGRYPDRLGYSWIEFGRLDSDGNAYFLTAGIALKAVEGKGIADRWFFVTNQRVGAELPLMTSTGTALGRDRLTEAIGEHGRVVRTAEQYRRMLDERLFQLGSDRYGALIDLLIQLRQPQLSKRPDPQLLSDALSEALAPLDPGLLADAAAGFHDLENQREELNGLSQAHDHLLRFQSRYAAYASVAARRQAGQLRTAQSQYEQSGKQLAEVRRAAATAEAAQREAAAEVQRLTQRQTELRAVQDQLRESPEIRELDRARENAERARLGAQAAHRRLTAARKAHEDAQANLRQAQAQAEEAVQRREVAETDAEALAQRAAAGTAHRHALEGAREDAAALRRALGQVADDRTGGVSAVRALQKASSEATGRATDAAKRLGDLEAERDADSDALDQAAEHVQETGAGLATQWRDFATRVDAVEVPYPDEVGLDDWVTAMDGPDPLSTLLEERVTAVQRELASQDALTRLRVGEIDATIGELTTERAQLEAGIPPVPVLSPMRDATGRVERAGAPLWRVVDFRENIPESSGLEAALEASGLLDAWITVGGRLLGPEHLDAVLLSGGEEPSGRTLADLLVPSIDPEDGQAGDLAEETVLRILRSIAVQDTASTGAGPSAVIGLDGSYRLGPLHGRWSKPRAEYLGVAAREQARRARIEALTAEIGTAETEKLSQESILERLAADRQRLTDQLRDRPSDQALRDAHAALNAASAQLVRREAALVPTRERVTETRERAAQAHDELTRTALDLSLPEDPEGLDQISQALGLYRAAASDLVAAVERHQDRAAELHRRQQESETSKSALELTEDDHRQAAEDELTAQARWTTLQESLGATVAELNTRLNATADELGEVSRTLPVRQGEHTEATKDLGMAQGREQQLLEDQEQLQSVRDAAVGAWRSFAGTGLLSVALPDLEVLPAETPWAVEPAVRLARQTEAGLTDVDDSDPAWKRVQDDITRRFTELAEALSRHGHQAQADLVEGRYVVTVLYSGRERPPAQLAVVLADEIELRERELTGRERQVLEEHLVGDVAGRLQELITEADELVTWMNAELAERPTSTGMRLRLSWRPDPDGPEGLREARGHLLRQTSGLWSEEDRATVRDFLQRQIQRVRAEQPLGTWTEHLRQALDYRGWHAFVIERLQDGAWRPAIGPASGGERVLTVSLPLFAAASAHYRSAHPLAPRLVLLDEAFAGVDDDARAKCLGLLTQFDLDVAMTSEREWGFYPTVPGIAAYQLVRHDGIDAVHVTAWEWDGIQPRQVVRPNLAPQAPERPSSRSKESKESKDEPEGLF